MNPSQLKFTMTKKFLATIFFVFSFHFLIAQSSDAPLLVKQGNDLLSQMKEEEALEKYKAALKSDPNNYEAAHGASLMCSRIGNRQTDDQKKREYFVVAKQYAVKSLKLNPTDAESNFVMAVAMGRMALISGSKDKVAASRDIKNYADLAVKYNPNHAGAWHVLGKWNYEVANLNFMERAAANSLFGGLPEGADVNRAIECYTKAIALDGNDILFYLDLAKAYDNIDKQDKAIETLKIALVLKPRFEDDANYLKQCKALLDELQAG